MGRVLDVARALAAAQDFLAIADVLCGALRARFAIAEVVVAQLDAAGAPVLVVAAERTPTLATRVPDRVRAVAIDHAPVRDGDVLALPLVEPAGLVGIVLCAPVAEPDVRALVTVAHHVSVRLAQLGLGRGARPVELTPRQHQVAQLAIYGQTTAEIAGALALSANTIKKHLRDIFARADVTNRTELATALARTAPCARVPVGTTRAGDLTISRAPPRG